MSVEVGEYQPKDVMQVVVRIGLPGRVAEERVTLAVDDGTADAQLKIPKGCRWVKFGQLVGEPDREGAVSLSPLWSGLDRGGKTTALSRPS